MRVDSSKYIFAADRREELQGLLAQKQYDLVVVGGGITGAGIALDAALRGLSVALIEKSDFASGTSSRSTKLIHGGLRYLKNMEFKLVRDVGIERAVAYKNAPHLVVPESMVMPLIKGGTYGKFATRIGLWLYDRLAKVERSERRKMLNKEQTLQREPLLRSEGLLGSGYYWEYRTDDARLTLEIMKTAAQYGAHCVNYMACEGFISEDGAICGVRAKDELTGNEIEIKGRKVVNATGPWVDGVRGFDAPVSGKRLHLTKGVHLVVPREKLNIQQSVYFDVPGGRMIFAIPRFDKTYLGTTDTNYTGPLEEPGVNLDDANYLLEAVNNMFPEANIELGDVVASWSGLRPLIHEDGKSPSELSRKDEIFISEAGLVTIAGGKLTGYRLMAQKVVDLVCKQLEVNQDCQTKTQTLVGGDFGHPDDVLHYIKSVETRLKSSGLNPEFGARLVRTFGKQCDDILEKLRNYSKDPLLEAQAVFCIKNENVQKLADFYVRRTGMMYFEANKVLDTVEDVLPHFVQLLGWDPARVEEEKKELDDLVRISLEFE